MTDPIIDPPIDPENPVGTINISPAVTAITQKLIETKAQLRTASKSAAECISCLDCVGDCETVRATGIQHVHLGSHREKMAEAVYLIEQAQAIMCEAHCAMKGHAEAAGIDLDPISTFGGVRR